MKKLLNYIVLPVCAILFVTGLGGPLLSAQTADTTGNGGNALRISPVRSSLTIEPGSSQSVTLNVQNLTTQTTVYKATINDFVAGNNELGQPELLLDSDKYAPSHSLRRYITPIQDTTIPANSAKDVKVTINIPKDAAGGGYYAAVRFAPTNGSKNGNVSLSASVGSLLLVRVPGEIKENLRLSSFDVRTSDNAPSASSIFTSSKKLYVVIRFNNLGNVHEQPFGRVLLKKDGKVIQSSEINNQEPRSNVLPDSIRRYSIKLTKVGGWGKYTVEGNFGYGTNGQLLSGKTSFTVIPMAIIIAGLVLLALILFAIFALPRAVKRYNQGVIRRSGRR